MGLSEMAYLSESTQNFLSAAAEIAEQNPTVRREWAIANTARTFSLQIQMERTKLEMSIEDLCRESGCTIENYDKIANPGPSYTADIADIVSVCLTLNLKLNTELTKVNFDTEAERKAAHEAYKILCVYKTDSSKNESK